MWGTWVELVVSPRKNAFEIRFGEVYLFCEDHGEKDRTVSRLFVFLVEDPSCPSLTSPIDRKLYWPHSLAAGAKSDEDPNLPNFARPMVCDYKNRS